MLALCVAGAQKREAGMPDLQDTGADDILELLEIAQALARAETALLTSDTTRAIAELQDMQKRAAVLAGKLAIRTTGNDVKAA
jgi:hypothetical protein